MKRHEMWRMQYHSRRYMEHLSDDGIEQRVRDVILNQTVLTEENKIGLHPINKEGEYWMVMWTHLLEEFLIRYGPYPAGFDKKLIKNLKLPFSDSPTAEKVCKAVKQLNIEAGKFLFKYSNIKWIEQTQKKGIVRISPATSYKDASLNPAVHDEELEFSIQPRPSEIKIEVIDHHTGKSKGFVNPIENKITKATDTNYYVYCLSYILTPRLFLDFEADACLIITKPNHFIDKVITAFGRQNPGWVGAFKTVNYLDPLNSSFGNIEIYSNKHFRFSYQKEVRFIGLPPKKVKELDHQYLEIGSLEDCSEIAFTN